MKRLVAIGLAGWLVGCGPTGQVRVERHLVCDEAGQNCQTVETRQEQPTTTDRIWQFLLLLALANR